MHAQAARTQTTASHPDRFLPKELLAKCIMLVESTHKEHGFLNLPARMTAKHNMVAIAMVDDRGMLILGNAIRCWRLRIVVWLSSLGIFGLAWWLNWWLLSGFLVIVIADQMLARLNRSYWRFLAAMLLSLEMLVSDFAGWGTAYPEAQIRALQALGMQTQWLDLYLPNRGNIPLDILTRFGPTNREDLGE